ncbi:hypothetical protein [Spirochaeta cellobiosiphila]|uniref:hypothetical protein n=1 Tax=Spirochaeta cellobiosiphila TaxID=504483 RepID=UPI00041BD218|nr:hypothetical protein [Spirochaeta cellobiosiphila]
MPAQITHWLFFNEVKEILQNTHPLYKEDKSDPGWLFLASQGGDVFYHNQHSMPSGVSYGALMHRRDGDSFLMNLAKQIGQSHPLFWLAFMTHAILDQEGHPYVVYFSTAVNPTGSMRKKWYQMHPFFERIMDRLWFEQRTGQSLFAHWQEGKGFDLNSLPERTILDALGLALELTYGEKVRQPDRSLRIHNAYRDTIGFLQYSDPSRRDNALWAAQRDQEDGEQGGRNRLALFHPVGDLDAYDFLNQNHQKWQHPVSGEPVYDSWEDIYDRAKERVLKAGAILADSLQGHNSLEALKDIITSRTWNVGDLDGKSHSPVFTKPFPLPDILKQEYSILDGKQ